MEKHSNNHNTANDGNMLLRPVLTWEHLSIYLPYGLEVMIDWEMVGVKNSSTSIMNISENGFDRHFNYAMQSGVVKIFGLRPISELTRDEAYKLVNDPMKFKFWHSKDNEGDYIFYEGYSSRQYRDMTKLTYPMVCQLAKWKFDFLGLIEKGYAVNINDVG